MMFSAKSGLRAYDVEIRIGHEVSNTERLLKIHKYLTTAAVVFVFMVILKSETSSHVGLPGAPFHRQI